MSNESNRPLTFELIGLGYWGPNLLRVLADMPDAEVNGCAISTLSPSSGSAGATRAALGPPTSTRCSRALRSTRL